MSKDDFFNITNLYPKRLSRKSEEYNEKVSQLEKYYLSNPKPSTKDKMSISHKIGMDLKKVKNWFQNKNAKERKKLEQRRNSLSCETYSSDSNDRTASQIFPSCNELYKRRDKFNKEY